MGEERNSNSKEAKLNRNFRNYQVYQQSLLISLLNQYAEIHISKPKKRSTSTCPFFTIDKIIFNQNDEIEISRLAERRSYEKKINDLDNNISIQTANRRYKNNKIIEILHILMDLLNEFIQPFETKTSEGRNGATKMETITKCRIGEMELNEEGIIEFGQSVNKQIMNLIQINDHLILSQFSISLY